MAIPSGKKARRQSSTNDDISHVAFKETKPLNYIQQLYLESIQENDITFGIGSAGTGKTFIAANYAANQIYHRKCAKVILTRPNVEVGRGLGFLPGTLEEKYEPYLEPFADVFVRAFGRSFFENLVKNKTIDPKPLGFMRGSTFDNAIILVDEAQNMTKREFKMLLSRIGRNSKIIISGDDDQTDIQDSGLIDAVDRLEKIRGVGVIEFTSDDIVRSKMCKEIILAYRD